VPGRDEVPAALRLPEVQVGGEDGAPPVQPALGVLDVDVTDAARELLGVGRGVEELVGEVARVEVDREAARPPARCP
jgi:hypothetical protein